MIIKEYNDKILPLDHKSMELSKDRWDNFAKPISSLGKIENVIIKIAGIQRSHNIDISKPVVCVMCADNGVVKQGVSQVDSEVTAIVAENMTNNKSVVCIMANSIGAKIFVVDIGINKKISIDGLINKKVMLGTYDMTLESAMSIEKALEAIKVGVEMAHEFKINGYNLIITGEMGIGNTTTSSAIASVMLNEEVENVTGKGAGLCSAGLIRKIHSIKKAIELNKPDKSNALDVLCKVGGLDIAGMVGLYIGGAIEGIPVMIDGFISGIAALIAKQLAPNCYEYMLPSHVSAEPAGLVLLNALGLEPMITCDMCLGEGTGAVAGFSLIKLGDNVYKSMNNFSEVNITKYVNFN